MSGLRARTVAGFIPGPGSRPLRWARPWAKRSGETGFGLFVILGDDKQCKRGFNDQRSAQLSAWALFLVRRRQP